MMKKLTKRRGVLRASVTRDIASVEELNKEDRLTKLETLRETARALKAVDDQILNLLIEDETVAEEAAGKELKDANDYQEKVRRVTKQIQEHPKTESRLPKLKLKEFVLEPKTWINFWAQFRRIHESSIEIEDKFLYLSMSLKPNSSARKLVDSYPISPNNYVKVIENLKNRFGQENDIVNSLHRELLQLVANKNANLTDLYDQLTCKLAGLESLGLNSEHVTLLYPLVEACLPDEIVRLWERSKVEKGTESVQGSQDSLNVALNNLDELMKFLGREVESEERLRQAGRLKKIEKEKKESQDLPTAAVLTSATKKHEKPIQAVKCIFCKAQHFSQDCKQVLSLEEKRKIVKEAGVCYSCLRFGHRRQTCRTKLICNSCKGHHYELMCHTQSEKPNVSSLGNTTQNVKPVLLKTLLVRVGKGTVVRALLDDGSQQSYITEELAKKLRLVRTGTAELQHMLFGGRTTAAVKHNLYDVTLSGLKNGQVICKMLGETTICGKIPAVRDVEILQKLTELDIYVSDVGESRKIELLLGGDVIAHLLTGKMCYVFPGLVAIETKLGWCLMGSGNVEVPSMLNCVFNLHNATLPSLWELETLGITESALKKDKDEDAAQCREFYEKTVQMEEGRYSVSLPWIEGHPPLESNRDIAVARLTSLQNRLKREGLIDTYDSVLNQWENEQIIERIEERPEETAHYLPHRAVISETKNTKLRVVFDAGAKRRGGSSLNECLAAGPNLLQSIIPLLVSFRQGNVGLVGDIRQAFLQIGINEADRDVLRFLWLRDGELIAFRHRRVVFGVTCSPFLLNATIQHHLQKAEYAMSHLNATVSKLKLSFYVDDFVGSFNTQDEASSFVQEASEVMLEAGFELRGWVKSGDAKVQTVLGLKWDVSEDTLGCVMPKFKSSSLTLTKKELLSLIGRVYDPMGFLAAPVLLLKMILQESFRLKVGWDETIPTPLQVSCTQWLNEVDLIDQIKFPRCIQGDADDISVHVFCDASARAMGTCIFLRCVHKDVVSIQFVAAKARVAPLESVTIPRKELIAALIAARFAKGVCQAFSEGVKVFYWSDSKVTLFWIKRDGAWKPFVSNRVKEIRQLTDKDCWNFTPGEINPSDLVSRGCSLRAYYDSKWWKGPEWLMKTPESWPSAELQADYEVLNEQKVTGLLNLHPDETEGGREWFTHFSSFEKNVRVMGWILRFVKNCRHGKKNVQHVSEKLNLTSQELSEAEKRMMIYIQIHSDLDIEHDLQVFRDEEDVLRVRTKILAEEFDPCFRTPIVLPPCKLVEALIFEKHVQHRHAGVTTLLGLLREDYWIMKGRRLVKSVVGKCVRCKLYKAKAVSTPAIPLPDNRVNMGKAFSVSGCDGAGPLFVKGGGKVWIILFTCAVYRAVHLELVDSLSTEAFVQALRRFIARRGRVSVMYTDNGSGFVKCRSDLAKIEQSTEFPRIRWILNAPTASWWGGFFERMVGVMKTLLRATLGRAVLSFTELMTVLTEVEATVNARPITYVTEDSEELRPIKPAMFLQEETECRVDDLDKVDERSLNARVRYIHHIRKCLKERFRREYLGSLAMRNTKASGKVTVGDVVWVGSDNKKRINWELGRVLELFPGKDGVVRVARVKTEKGELLRPVQRLYPLEVDRTEVPESEFPGVVQSESVQFPTPNCDGDSQNTEIDESYDETDPENSDPSVIEAVGSRVTSRGRVVKRPTKLDL